MQKSTKQHINKQASPPSPNRACWLCFFVCERCFASNNNKCCGAKKFVTSRDSCDELDAKGQGERAQNMDFRFFAKTCAPGSVMSGGRSDGCLKSKRCDVNIYMSSAARKIATIEIVLCTPLLMLETSNEESESDEVEVLLTFSLLLLSASSEQSIVHVLCTSLAVTSLKSTSATWVLSPLVLSSVYLQAPQDGEGAGSG